MSAAGTKRTWRRFSVSSAFGGKAEILCSDRVFPLMTKPDIADVHFQEPDCNRPTPEWVGQRLARTYFESGITRFHWYR
jgi:hypothetical protein